MLRTWLPISMPSRVNLDSRSSLVGSGWTRL